MKGFKEVRSKLVKMPDKITKAGEEGLREVGKNIFDESQNIVPYDTGELKASGEMYETGSGGSYKILIEYDADYAIYVHEILRYHHPHGQAKYLEKPFTKHTAKSRLNSVMKSKVGGVL
ncbi:MAG TPA: HK97 gp10 family phage protein [Chitinispirillaceae bacterium]|nr:HK97 gp10 family phage protein [Chitinispirillaceae bacterium]